LIRHLTCAVAAASLASACARQAPPPPPTPTYTDTVLHVETRTIEDLVPGQATLETLLRQHALPTALVQAAIESSRAVFNPRHLRAQRPYRLVLTGSGTLKEFEYSIDDDRFLRIESRDRTTPEKLEAEVLPYEKERTVVAIRGRIDSAHPSLIAAMEEAGARLTLAISLADIFGGEVDFENDLQPGDMLEVLVESTTYEGRFAGYGPILAARLVNDGRTHEAVRWVSPETQKAGYYDDKGRSLKRFVLASPLKFVPRVTSGFSRSRLHPVYRTYRAHLGVDYAAATGTPVVAVANGVVLSAGWAGGGGRQVHIKHTAGLESYYLHLSSFASGVRAGAQVDQGQLIGRVGASGTATGPHLDYRLRKNGVFVDPRREHAKQPPGEPIPAAHLAAFSDLREDVERQLSTALLASATPAPTAGDAVRAKQ
jgi:murein DD-endopeptidase MepM/ murein hydrolase activator NlpD